MNKEQYSYKPTNSKNNQKSKQGDGRNQVDHRGNTVNTLRTLVTETPLLTSVSAIQPPRLADNAIVSQGNTQNSPDSVRLNFKTYNGSKRGKSPH